MKTNLLLGAVILTMSTGCMIPSPYTHLDNEIVLLKRRLKKEHFKLQNIKVKNSDNTITGNIETLAVFPWIVLEDYGYKRKYKIEFIEYDILLKEIPFDNINELINELDKLNNVEMDASSLQSLIGHMNSMKKKLKKKGIDVK